MGPRLEASYLEILRHKLIANFALLYSRSPAFAVYQKRNLDSVSILLIESCQGEHLSQSDISWITILTDQTGILSIDCWP